MTIYIGNLSFQATEEDLREVFAEYGKVSRISLPTIGKLAGSVGSRLSKWRMKLRKIRQFQNWMALSGWVGRFASTRQNREKAVVDVEMVMTSEASGKQVPISASLRIEK